MRAAAGAAADLGECLRRYLEEHPGAADNLLGIREWWLPERLRNVALEELEAVIERLVEAGEILRNTLPDRTELYTAGHRAGKP